MSTIKDETNIPQPGRPSTPAASDSIPNSIDSHDKKHEDDGEHEGEETGQSYEVLAVRKETSHQDGSPTEADQVLGAEPEAPAPETSPADLEAGTLGETAQKTKTNNTTSSGPPYTAFSNSTRWFIVFMAGSAAFFSPLSGQIYYPVMPTLVHNYNLTTSLINLSITTYMIFQGLAPSFMGTFSDASGRRPAYALAFLIYTIANIGLALQNNYAALLILRCLQSAGSSGTVSFGYGVIADVSTTAERGSLLGPMAAGIMVAPALGPVIGGLLSQFLGWRAVFWFLTIISGGYLVVYAILMPETHRKIVGNGSVPPVEVWRLSLVQYIAAYRKKKRMNAEELAALEEEQEALRAERSTRKIGFPNPLKSFAILMEPDAFLIILYTGIVSFANFALMTSIPNVFPGLYGLNDLQVGLCYLPLGIAACIAAVANGKLLDWNYRRLAHKLNMPVDRKRGDNLRNFPIERARITSVFYVNALQTATLLCYGWVLQKGAPLAVPLIFQFLMGLWLVAASNSMSTLLVDLFPDSASTASAASNLLRCIFGAIGAAVIDDMLTNMGYGWSFLLMGLLVGLASVLLVVELKYGMGWRGKRWDRLAEKKREKEEREKQRQQDKQVNVDKTNVGEEEEKKAD